MLFFSPLQGDRIPSQAESLYLPGGYPELHGESLEANHRFRREPPGFYREVLSKLIEARDQVRAELKKLDPKSGAVKEENPKFLKTGDAAIVKIKPTKPVVAEEYKKFPQLGRFAIRDMGQTVAAGMIISVKEKK